jgi:hypothetical protein
MLKMPSHEQLTLDDPLEIRKQSALEEGEASQLEPKEGPTVV